MSLAVDLGKLAEDTRIGDSIAINGVCLTVVKLERDVAVFDISGETLAKSTLGRLKMASPVNVERALKPNDRFGGHIVQGHVDGTATIKKIDQHGQFVDMRFAAATELLDQMVTKGSVALDGISLTIADMDRDCFSVALIPQTLERTTMGRARVGDIVNVETDIIAKMIKKQLDKILPQQRKLTIEKLKQLGF
jgi:riboflavin synthase